MKALREFLVFLFFVALSIAFTWPAAIRLNTAVSDPGDPLLNAWILDWVCRAVVHNPLHLFDAPIFYPAKFPLAYSENMLGIALPMLPLHLAGLAPMTLYNVAMILGFAFSGFGAYVLGRTLTSSMAASIIGGALYAFTQFRVDHLAHLQIIWSGWMPLILACVIQLYRQVTPRRCAALSICLVMNALTNVHWFLFGTTAAALTFIVLRGRTKREWLQIASAFVVAGVVLLPVLYPYRVVSKIYDFKRSPGEARGGSGEITDWFHASNRNLVWGRVLGEGPAERSLFPNAVPLAMLAVALWSSRRERSEKGEPARALDARLRIALDVLFALIAVVALCGAFADDFDLTFRGHRILSLHSAWLPVGLLVIVLFIRFHRVIDAHIAGSRIPIELWICLLWIAIGVFAAFGMKGFFHHFLYRVIPVFRSVRAPVRWAIVAYTGLAGTSAVGLAALAKRWRATYAVASIAALIDIAPAIAWQHAPATLPPVYAAIDRGPIVEMPIRTELEYQMLHFAAQHHRVSMNGISGFEPPLHRDMRTHLANVIEDVESAHGRFVIVHEDWLEDDASATHALIASAVQQHRLAYVGRYDHGAGGDWLFRVGADGRPLDDDYARFIDGKPTQNHSTFGKVETCEVKHGTLTVRGFALSPNGVQRVDLLFNSGRVRVPANFEPRPDVDAQHPWYPHAKPSGFSITLDRRPSGVPAVSDLQIEIVDGANRATRLDDVALTWR